MRELTNQPGQLQGTGEQAVYRGSVCKALQTFQIKIGKVQKSHRLLCLWPKVPNKEEIFLIWHTGSQLCIVLVTVRNREPLAQIVKLCKSLIPKIYRIKHKQVCMLHENIFQSACIPPPQLVNKNSLFINFISNSLGYLTSWPELELDLCFLLSSRASILKPNKGQYFTKTH